MKRISLSTPCKYHTHSLKRIQKKDYLYHDTQQSRGAWFVPPLPSSPPPHPALHHIADWIIVFCHCHCNAYPCDYLDVGDTTIHMPVTLSTDGCVIASTRWQSPCFVIRFIVIFLWVVTISCFHSHFPFRILSILILSGLQHLIMRYRQAPDKAHWVVTCWLSWHSSSICSPRLMVEKRFPLSHALKDFFTLKYICYWLVEVTIGRKYSEKIVQSIT